jgi:hypothetical protein
MTDAGEKLRQRAIKHWNIKGYLDKGDYDIMEDFARLQLEQAAKIAEQCECGREGCSVAAAIRKLKGVTNGDSLEEQ